MKNVQEVLELQHLMDSLSDDVRADFLNGTNGAVVSEISFYTIIQVYRINHKF